MRAIVLMFDSLNREMLGPYGETFVDAPNFQRLAGRTVTFDTFYAGSMPCMPARREMHTGRYNFLHRGWGPLEPFDDSAPELLKEAGVHTHLASDHPHYWEDGGATYHPRFSTWEFFRGQEGDPWKGVVGTHTGEGLFGRMRSQDLVNRSYMPTEAEHNQTLTVDAGLHFMQTNVDADEWLLQLELFDPHEPFFSHQPYKDRYPHDYDGPEFDWPGYRKVAEPQSQVDHARYEYAALVSMCDHSLGRVLDFMDAHDMWDDTLLIVNTDHGYLLGEHGWWAKGLMPWYDELVHLPFFMWDPRTGARGTRCNALAQTIDLAPTLLRFFGLDPTADMQGRDLGAVLADESVDREAALFGLHGAHVNVTDGRWVYMRASEDASNQPLQHFTLMPTHMRRRFGVDELGGWEPAEPFGFTKGLRTMAVDAAAPVINPWQHGSLLFDLAADPRQERPVRDDEAELRMLRLLAGAMRDNDAPASQYERLGIPRDGQPGREHLHVATHAARAEATAQPLPLAEELAAAAVLDMPLQQVLEDPVMRRAVESHIADLTSTELLTGRPGLTLLDLAAAGQIPTSTLTQIDRELAAAVAG